MGKVLRIIEFYLFGRISLSTSYVTGFVQVFGPIFQLGWLSGTVYGRLFQFLVLKVLSPGNYLGLDKVGPWESRLQPKWEPSHSMSLTGLAAIDIAQTFGSTVLCAECNNSILSSYSCSCHILLWFFSYNTYIFLELTPLWQGICYNLGLD